jgi:hypothetical protein
LLFCVKPAKLGPGWRLNREGRAFPLRALASFFSMQAGQYSGASYG